MQRQRDSGTCARPRHLDFAVAFDLSRSPPVKPVAPSAAPASGPHLPPAVEEDLAVVETRLAEELASREERLHAVAAHLVRAGGKRVRPAVVLLVFHAAANGRPRRRADAIEAA